AGVHQHRADDVGGNRVQDLRRPRARHLLGEDDLLLQRGAAAAVRPRPLDADPATRRQLALPGALERTPFLLVLRRRRAREMADEPVADLGAERLLLGAVVQREHLGGRPKTASWVGSGRERVAIGGSGGCRAAAGKAGAAKRRTRDNAGV